ncbi:MAG: hypothetical protein ABSB76_39275, partial [Streptosporangiaceae bacterium]
VAVRRPCRVVQPARPGLRWIRAPGRIRGTSATPMVLRCGSGSGFCHASLARRSWAYLTEHLAFRVVPGVCELLRERCHRRRADARAPGVQVPEDAFAFS